MDTTRSPLGILSRTGAFALVLLVGACSESPTAEPAPEARKIEAPAFLTVPGTDVTYGTLHGTVRFYNTGIISVSGGSISGNTAVVPPGASVRVKGNWQLGPITDISYCPTCIVQIYVAWVPPAAGSGATPFNLGLRSGLNYPLNPNPGPSGSFDWTTTAPNVSGEYFIGKGETWDYMYQWYAQGGTGWVTGNPSQSASSFRIIVEGTPPVITPTVTGTLGLGGWYTSNVGITWSVTDPESAVTSTTGCGAVTVSTDTNGTTYTCSATSLGGTASQSVTIKRDATDPSIVWSGNAGTYDLSGTVAITCAASDAMSGLASDTCANVSGPAWSLGLGSHTFSATASDNAGNDATVSTSFTVTASFAGTCALVEQFVAHAGVANSLCAKLRAAEKAKTAGARSGPLNAFINEVTAQTGLKVPADKAPILIAAATALL